MVERSIGTLKTHLAKAMAFDNKRPKTRKWQWPRLLPKIIANYNNSKRRSTNTTPTLGLLPENREAIVKYQPIYYATFKHEPKSNYPVKYHFQVGDKVGLRKQGVAQFCLV